MPENTINVEFLLDEDSPHKRSEIQGVRYNAQADILEVEIFNRQLSFSGVVDLSEQIDYPTVYVANLGDDMVFFGGSSLYCVAKENKEIKIISVGRDKKDVEHWRLKFIHREQVVYLISESAVLAIDEGCNLRWRQQVYYDFVIVSIDDSSITFQDGEGLRHNLDLDTGKLRMGSDPHT